MVWRAFAVWFGVLLAACSSCRGASPDAMPGTDGGVSEAYQFVDVILPDRLEPPPDLRCGRPGRSLSEQPPWADCTLRITPTPVQPAPMPPCGPGRFVLEFPLGPSNENCFHDGWIYSGRGFSRRVRLSDGRVETLTRSVDPQDLDASWGCSPSGLVAAVRHRSSRAAAIVHFTDLEHPGRVQWNRTLLPPDPELSVGGAYQMRASDVFSFFLYEDQTAPFFHVASPTGEAPRRLDLDTVVGHINSDFAIGGRYLSYSSDWDIHLYDHTTGRDENLTRSDSVWEQFSALDGDRVVYIDHRTRDPADYNNANVWLLDLVTRKRTAITSQPAQPPAQRFSPAVGGDWILWEDTRDQPDPQPGIRSAPYRNLYGYNLRTRREVALVPGTFHSGYPLIVGNRLYYSCAPTRGSRIGTYVMDLPPG